MKIIAVGMNYLQYNKELSNTLYKGENPVVYLKADSSLIKDHKPFFLPDELGRVDYEAGLVVRISRLGKSIQRRFAYRYYDAVTVGVEFTARDMQKQFQEEGLPCDLCKGFDGATVLGEWIAKDELDLDKISNKTLDGLHFYLNNNEECVQRGCSSDMIFGIDEIIEYVSRFMTLRMGDIIFTGAPTSIGPVAIGDRIEGWLEDKCVLEMKVK